MKLKAIISLSIIVSVLITCSACAEAKTKVQLSSKKITLTAGKSKSLKLSGTSKKVGFKVTSGKKIVKLKRTSNNSVRITALKKGTAKIKAVLGKKTYTCSVTVKAKSGAAKTSAESVSVKINGKSFAVKLNGSQAAQQLRKMLPLTVTMNELNGNEKYHYFDTDFSGTSETFATIKAGDLMIYGGNCLVLFYDEIKNSPYGYVKVGELENAAGLKDAVGGGSISAEFIL